MRDKIEIAYTESDDAIRNKVDVLLRNPRTANPEVNFSVTDAKLSARIPNDRVHLEQTLNNWALTNQSLSTSANIAEVAKSVELSIDETKAYLELLAMAINGALPTSQTSQTTIDTWKTNISVARTNVNSAITALIGADEKYRAAMHAVTIAENELSLKKAGATAESVAAQEAKIAAMRATVSNYDAQLAKNVLRASFSGVVTKQDAKLGQSVSVGQSLVSLISDGMYKITANVPEVDIAKVKIADVAEVTLDAYGSDEKFVATVSSIDPAETIIEGVPTYKVTLRFNDRDTRIKSGMTANIVMRTNEKKDVLVVPARAILLHEGDNTRYVRLLVGGVAKEIPVQIGLRGSNGMVEILSGLNQGDQVVTFEKSAQ
jgi:RND family efflux transporter MFP subunit